MNKFVKFIAAAVLPALALTGCNSNNDDPQPETFMCIATLESTSTSGTSFTTREEGDSPLVTFTTSRTFEKDQVTIGNRYLLAYSNASGKRMESGPINLYALYGIINGDIKTATLDEIKEMQTSPINTEQILRQGQYLNFYSSAPMMLEPKTFGLYVDEATIDAEMPDVYIAFVSDVAGTTSEKYFYSSFDISDVWDLFTCRGIRLHYEKNGQQETKDITKEYNIKPVE